MSQTHAAEAAPSLTLSPPPTPRARVLRGGVGALSDVDVLRALLGAGVRAGVLETVERHGLRSLGVEDANGLAMRLGDRNAATTLAAVELGRRVLRTQERRPRLRTPAEIDAHLRPQLGGLAREVFHVLCFNARNVLLADVRVAEGTVNACPVDPREVFRAALGAHGTCALVLAHNHPSGDPEPSSQDIALTAQLVDGARLLGLRVLDHLVLGDLGFVSLLERGLMPLR